MKNRVPPFACLLALFALVAPACSDDSVLDAAATSAVAGTDATPSSAEGASAAAALVGDDGAPASSVPRQGDLPAIGPDGPPGGTATTVTNGVPAGGAPTGSGSGGVAGGAGAAPAGPAPAAPASTVPPPPENRWALAYAGGFSGPATGEPLRIGYVNQEAFFPEASTGLDAAVALVNEELGGAAGRPIEVVECRIAAPADGPRCGQQFAADPSIIAVVTGTMLFGNKGLYDALAGVKPVLIGNGVTTDDFSTPAGLSYSLGSVTVLPALPLFATRYLRPTPSSAALLVPDRSAQLGAVDFIMRPILERAGVATTVVPIPNGATAADVVAALQATGAAGAQVFLAVTTVQDCVAIDGAIRELGITPTVVTTALCAAPPMTAHLAAVGEAGPVPEGWYFAGNGYNVFDPDEPSGMRTYVNALREHAARLSGQSDPAAATTAPPAADPLAIAPDFTGYSAPVFANVLTLAKFANRVGAAALSPQAIEAEMRAFRGPMMLQAGVLRCGVEPYVAVCGHYAGVQRFTGGRWVSAADATNNRAIDVRAAS